MCLKNFDEVFERGLIDELLKPPALQNVGGTTELIDEIADKICEELHGAANPTKERIKESMYQPPRGHGMQSR